MKEIAIPTNPQAILFDVDGTLYRQRPLRFRMAFELALHALTAPLETFRIVRIIRTFRTRRENLRRTKETGIPFIKLQYKETGEQTGIDPDVAAQIVSEWMERRPVRHLLACRRKGIVRFLEHCRTRGIFVGAYSDYPTRAKVEALKISEFFNLHLCSTDREINAFKPSPAGIQAACRRWNLNPDSILYVGDRMDIDGEASQKAGVGFVLMGKGRSGEHTVKDFFELGRLLGWE